MKRVVAAVLAVVLAGSLLATPVAASQTHKVDFQEGGGQTQVSSLYAAAADQGRSPTGLVKFGVYTIHFILSISGQLGNPAPGSVAIPTGGNYRFNVTWQDNEVPILNAVRNHYAISAEQAQRFGATLVVFFVGVNARNEGRSVAPVQIPPPNNTGGGSGGGGGGGGGGNGGGDPDPCAELPVPSGCDLDTWKAQWDDTLALLDFTIRGLDADTPDCAANEDVLERAGFLRADAGASDIADEAQALVDAIADCNTRQDMIDALNTLGDTAFATSWSWWYDSGREQAVQLIEALEAGENHQRACDEAAALGVPSGAPEPRMTNRIAALQAALDDLGSAADCDHDPGDNTSLLAGTAIERVKSFGNTARGGATANYPLDSGDSAKRPYKARLISIRSVLSNLAGDATDCEVPAGRSNSWIDSADSWIEPVLGGIGANPNVQAVSTALDDAVAACDAGSGVPAAMADAAATVPNLDTLIEWTV